ncbi:LacI family DNA-binding transcriptional regulator [Ruminococcaceae bacterium OttesenSCG-928-A11]|nr:LacI family DNA-binding transcriptional regulator [Ruminococcaceae bacterium OttesenSCG-928-A11]
MPSIKEVAEKAGVSVTTVSRVLNKRGYISQEMYEQVYAAMEALDYYPNQMARNLAKQRTQLVGLLIPDVGHPFFAVLARELETRLNQTDYKVLLCNTVGRTNREREYLNMLRQNRVDGIIIGSHMLQTKEYDKINLPIVSIDMVLGQHIPTISSDHALGGRLAAQRLIACGCRQVLQVHGDTNVNTPALLRHQTFEQALCEAGVECINYELKTNEFHIKEYYPIVDELLDRHRGIDGFFSTDIIAANTIKAAYAKGISIPGQLNVVGYDGTFLADLSAPTMTCVRQNIGALADALANTLLAAIEGKQVPQGIITVPGIELTEGETTRQRENAGA